MKNIVVLIEYATISPIIVANYIAKTFPCFVSFEEVFDDYFELRVLCRQEDTRSIERYLAQFV